MSTNTKENILYGILGNAYSSRDELLYYCPFCKHHKKKLSINIEKLVFKCWVCDTKGSISYIVKRFGSAEDRHQWELLNQEIDMSSVERMFEIKETIEEQTIELPKEYFCLAQKDLPYSAREPLSYLMSRGVSASDILYYKIGYCDIGKYRKRIIIPSYNLNGDCDFFSARTYGKDWLKYKNPPASKNIIFNDLFIDWSSDIVLVEGVFDAIRAGRNSIPLLGSTLNDESKLLSRIVQEDSAVYIALDPDAWKKEMRIIETLLKFDIEVWKIDINDYEDVGAMPADIFQQAKQEAKKINFDNFLAASLKNL